MPTRRKFTGALAAAFAVVASGAVFATIPGCGEDTTPIETKPPEEQHKASMEYMQKKYASKKGKS